MLTREQSMLLKALKHFQNLVLENREVPKPDSGICYNVLTLIKTKDMCLYDAIEAQLSNIIYHLTGDATFPIESTYPAYSHKSNSNKYSPKNKYYTHRMKLLSDLIEHLENLEKDPEHVPTPIPVNDSNTLRSDQV